MTRPLRRAHWWIWLALAAALPLLLLAAIGARMETTPVNPGFHWGSAR